MNKLLEKRNTVYGFCAIWIVLFHTYRRIGMPYIPILTNVIGIGNMAVDIFFFFSGLCIGLSAQKNRYLEMGWSGYFRKRFIRVVIPYLIICIPYYLWNAACESSGSIIHKVMLFTANLSSMSFWIKGTQTTWFVYGIVVFYFLFPLIYRFLEKAGLKKQLGLVFIMIGFAIVSAYTPILENSTIVWARLPIFTIGVLTSIYKDAIKEPNRKELVIASITVVLLGWVISSSEISDSFTIPQVYRMLLYIPLTLSVLLLVSQKKWENGILEWTGNVSLEIYLIHVTLLHPIKYYGGFEFFGYWLYLALPVVTILLAWLVLKTEKHLLANCYYIDKSRKCEK